MGNIVKEEMGVAAMKVTERFKELRKMFQLKNHCWRMYVKPFSKAGVQELEDFMKNAYAMERLTIREKEGTYEITSRQPIDNVDDYVETLWGMLHRKYEHQCTELAAEPVTVSGFRRALKWHENDLGLPVAAEDRDKNFYILVISPEFIEANTLPKFRMAS